MLRVPILFPLALVALPLAAEFLGGPFARAQDATPAAVLVPLPPLLQQLVDGANAGDGAAVAALYAEYGVHEDVPAGVMPQGREEIAAFVDGVVSQFRDVRLEPVSARQAGDLAVLEYTFSGTDLASERSFAYRGVLVFELDGTLIRRSADYYDLASVLGQLGQLETSQTAPAATPAQ